MHLRDNSDAELSNVEESKTSIENNLVALPV
jgi:hypothetical protein